MKLRIAIFVGRFPVVSETFILRQITGLLDLGHAVDIYADTRGDTDCVQPEVGQYRLGERTTYMDMPEASAPWELPAWPLAGETWVPGQGEAVPNWIRLADALPALGRCLERAPALAEQALSETHYGHQARSLSALYRLDRLAARPGGYDVLHAHFGPVADNFRFARALWRAPLVVSFHGYDFTTLPRRHGAGMYDKLFAVADAVTVNSAFTWGRVERLGCSPAKLHRLPVGLPLGDTFPFRPRVRQSDEPVRLLTVARLVEIKGHEHALRAMALLKAQDVPIRYDIVGEGPQRAQIERWIREWNLGDRVTLHGARDATGVRELLEAAHLALLGSVNVEGDAEGQGLFLQEAQACGLPVVATEHGALPEGLVPGRSGFLVPERDVEAMAGRLRWLVEHPETWPELGRAGRAFVEERYEIGRLNRQLVDLYETARAGFAAGKGMS